MNWHWGFSAAGFGKVLGLVQYRLGFRHLGRAGQLETDDDPGFRARRARIFYLCSEVVGVLAATVAVMAAQNVLGLSFEQLARWLGYLIVALALAYFGHLHFAGGYGVQDRRRIVVIC